MFKTLFRKDILHQSRGRLLSTAGLCLAMFGASATAATTSSTTKICSASDLHYFAPSLLVKDGVAFQTYLAQDRKLIAESKSITEALVAKINEEKPAFFLVTGDLTKDGEKLSHQELAVLLESIENNGVTKVFVIPGNHDINNPDAKSFDGDNATAVDYVTPAEFKSIYDKFGYGEAAMLDTASITYLAKPSAKLWILGVDACMYKDNIATGHPITSGKINANTWKWILDRMAEAKAAGATVVGMMHHGLVEHYAGQNASYPEYLVTGWDTVSTKLADAGLKLMFTGHYHANDITKKAGTGTNFVFDIETGSTVTWPCPYRVMNLNANNYFDITTKHIEAITYDTKGKTFSAYAKEYLDGGLTGLVKYALTHAPYSLDDATATAMTPHVVAAYAAHYAGDEKMPAAEKGFIAYLAANNNASFAAMLTGLWTDFNPSDNSLYINLASGAAQTKQSVQFVYTSDAHYGITRANFQGATAVNAQTVNAAMIAKINSLPTLDFPADNGVNAGTLVGNFDYVIQTGDIANRSESSKKYQSAAASWAQFKTDYIDGLTLSNNAGTKAGLWLAPGNHDVSNAIGYYKTLNPVKDSTSMVNIYNMMMPSPRPAGVYNYANEKIHYSRNVGGVHFMFVNMWPDSTERVWMEKDLKSVSISTPVVIFTHDEAAVESKHFTNPNGKGDINATDAFENLISEVFKDGKKTINDPSTIEQRGFTQFVKAHRNIVAYFHGNTNFNEYYTYRGTDSSIALNTFRIDSPMKGEKSATDEKLLSFQTLSIDTITKQLTVRECLWNTNPADPATPISFGASKTVDLAVGKNLAAYVNTLVDTNYTVPSWTLMKKAAAIASSVGDSASIVALNAAIAGLVSKNKPYSITVNINGNPKTQMGFAWFTNAGVKGGKVELVEGTATEVAFATSTLSFAASCDSVKNLNYNIAANGLAAAGIADNTKKTFMSNKALATGLKAGTTYSYRVGKAGAWSAIGTFTTAKDGKDAFSFVYFTDPQAQTDEMFSISAKTTHAAMKMYPQANFWLTGGDLVETSGASNAEWEYEQFFATQQDIWMKYPFAPLTGNHDKSTNKNFTNHFNTANPSFDKKMATAPGSVYSFVYGDALFMALSYEDYSVTNYLDSLATWMNAQVKAHPEVKWRVAFFHKTMYTGSNSHQSDADGKLVREKMGPVFDSLKIDWALQGHDHIYELIGPLKAGKLVANSINNQQAVTATVRDNVTGKLGGTFDVTSGTLYFLNNSAGKKKYEPRTRAQMDAAATATGITNYFDLFSGRFGQTGEPTFSNITVSTDTIKVSTYTVSDAGVATLFDEFKITKTVHVDKVALNIHDVKALPSRNINLTATVLPIPAADKAVTWKSSDETIATVKAGVVTTLKAGVAKIYAVANDGGSKDSCIITVVAPKALYVRGDFHQHTTYTDGSYSFAHMMQMNNKFGLDWWANSEHGGAFGRDGKMSGLDSNKTVYFDSYTPNPILGTVNSSSGHQNIWRWQMLSQYEYSEMLAARQTYSTRTLIQSYEWNVPGHEHGSMGLIAGQFGEKTNCDALSQFEFMFDNSDADQIGGVAQGWTKSTKSGHEKTLEALAWLQNNYGSQSYVVPAHPERQKKYTIAHFRDMNNTAPDVCFGFESMPGHQKEAGRGGYSKSADGGGTYGGCGVYAAKVGGLWDAMLSEGRHFWLFANSDCHSEDGDFYPGEYQKNYTYTKDNSSAQAIVDGLRSGNTWITEGDLIDSLIYQITPATNTALTASMGETLQLTEKGINITIKMRDPQGANYNTYSSYKTPALHHVDVIMGAVGAKLDPTAANYNVPSVATTKVIARFDANGATIDANGVKSTAWTSTANGWKEMTLHLDNITDSAYFRLRATNLSLDVTNETDAAGNPLADTLMGANNPEKAFADLWMYSNPIFVAQTKVFVDSVKLSAKTATIEVGKSADISATIYPATASDKVFTIISTNEEIATIVDGKINALKAGKVKIAVTTNDGAKTDTCVVTTVVSVASVSFVNKTETIEVGKTLTITASVLPSDASNQSLVWTSSAASIVRVINGELFALKAGSAIITATSVDGQKAATCTVTVSIPPVVVILDHSSLDLTVGSFQVLYANIYPATASNQAVEWSSNNAAVAKVENGVVRAISAGQAIITVTTLDGKKAASCIVEVKEKPITNIADDLIDALLIFPVPTSNELTIVIPQELGVTNLRMIANNGVVVLARPVEGLASLKLDVSSLAIGTYYIQFQTANGTISKQVSIK